MAVKFLATTFLVVSSFFSVFGQWTKITDIPTQEIVALDFYGDTLYAASGTNLLYRSIDGGTNWTPLAVNNPSASIYSFKVIDNVLYVGTLNSGIYVSSNAGISWANYSSTLPAVSDFKKFNGTVYASTEGNGVYRFDLNSNNWQPFNNQLPSNLSYNVQTIASTSGSLIIGAGGNGTFYHYDFLNGEWIVGYYYGTVAAGLSIDKIVSSSDTLFAVNGLRTIRSDNGGATWVNDNMGTHNGIARGAFMGNTTLYAITNLVAGGTWIQQRNKNAAVGATWSNGEEFIPALYSFDICEFNNRLFLATDDGLYVKDLVAGLFDLTKRIETVSIYPNPSVNETMKINSSFIINRIELYNLSGKLLCDFSVEAKNFELPTHLPSGEYLVKLYYNAQDFVSRKILFYGE